MRCYYCRQRLDHKLLCYSCDYGEPYPWWAHVMMFLHELARVLPGMGRR